MPVWSTLAFQPVGHLKKVLVFDSIGWPLSLRSQDVLYPAIVRVGSAPPSQWFTDLNKYLISSWFLFPPLFDTAWLRSVSRLHIFPSSSNSFCNVFANPVLLHMHMNGFAVAKVG